MAQTNQSRQRGTGGLGDLSFCKHIDSPKNSPHSPISQAENDAHQFRRAAAHGDSSPTRRARLQFLAARLHALGPKPLFHFLDEVERGEPLRAHLERYAALPADFIRAHGGDQFPKLFAIREGMFR
jgi:hypothetical protein